MIPTPATGSTKGATTFMMGKLIAINSGLFEMECAR